MGHGVGDGVGDVVTVGDAVGVELGFGVRVGVSVGVGLLVTSETGEPWVVVITAAGGSTVKARVGRPDEPQLASIDTTKTAPR